ncbi:transposase [Ensifer sp. WSM1721]|uniref:transposase n=1 Tax=Ensifer sp. WSM1721 TaxID=1041159 RepID=UPI0012EBA97F
MRHGSSTRPQRQCMLRRALERTLSLSAIVLRDNPGNHKSLAVCRAIRKRGPRPLPPYGPDLNHIEQLFSNIK